MEDIHNFLGGMHSNFDEQNQPKNTYREAYNWIRLEDGSLVAEDGSLTIEDYPTYLKVLGSVALDGEIIFVSYGISPITDEPMEQIGIFGTDNLYVEKIATEGELGLSSSNQLKIIAKKDYRGNRIIYLVDINGSIPARRIDIDETYTDIASETLNFLESKLPIVTLDTVSEDGSLPTGIYQFSARLVTTSGNRTAAGLLTNIIPVTNESTSSGVEQFDGDLPQTSSFKAINLNLSNLDTRYKFVEIICTTYEGLTNTPKSNVVGIKTILSSSMDFTYSTLEQNKEEVTLDEITVEPIEYTNPKTIEQKDNRLIYGNLGVNYYDPNFQAIANNIVVKYKVQSLDYYETISIDTTAGLDNGGTTGSFNNYDGEAYTTKYRGYQRDEVYSFAIVPIFKNGSTGYAYHIPGNDTSTTTTTDANTTTKELGTYICSTEEYPDGYGYPVGKVRHHKFPNMYQEPIYDGSKIRVLGVQFENIVITDENVIGYAIVRELRTEDNKSILAQGIVNPLINDNADPNGKRIVSPWTGKANYKYASGVGNYLYNELAFYSPETTIWNNSLSQATHVKSIALLQGRVYMVGQQRSGGSETRYAHMFANYTTVYNDSVYSSVALDRSTIQYVGAGTSESNLRALNGTNINVETKLNNGFLFFKTQSDLQIYQNMSTKDMISGDAELSISNDTTAVVRFHNSGVVQDQDDANNQGDTKRNLFNIVANKENQYGEVLDSEYILVDYKLNLDSTIECFGGDTFINKTALVSTTCDLSDRQFRTMSYFFCESMINTAYRHWIPDKTIPYYPKNRKFWVDGGDGILQIEPKYGHANGYNKQYSFENTLKKFYSKQILQPEEITRFPNRVIYSEQSIEGEQYDAYRVFLQNNYHDIPKNKGEITNVFVHKNDLFIHTTQSLWKSSFNERVIQASSAGEVVLGNGGLFPTPSLEIFPTAGGYAGRKNESKEEKGYPRTKLLLVFP